MSSLGKQVGGQHYKDMPIQPVVFIHANGIGYFEGNAIKYLSRWKSKGGLQDLEKAVHFIELLIELEAKKQCRKHRHGLSRARRAKPIKPKGRRARSAAARAK